MNSKIATWMLKSAISTFKCKYEQICNVSQEQEQQQQQQQQEQQDNNF